MLLGARLTPVVELVSMIVVSAFGVGQCCTWCPWMSLVHMLVVIIFI